MSDFIDALQSEVLLCDGAMGSYLFELTGRLSEPNHVYETFNVDRPELVQQVHASYLAAGARCLKTNTFGANRAKLRSGGLEPRLVEINRAGVTIAREAIDRFQQTQPASSAARCFVLASIGPTEQPLTDEAAVADCYRDQLETVIAAGADAILFETFSSLPQLELLVDLVRSLPQAPPVIAEMTIQSAHDTGTATLTPDPGVFLASMIARDVPVAGVNCCAPWDATAFIDAAAELEPVQSGALQLVAMPNAGGFQRIGNRFMSSVNPEFMGRLARSFRDRGLRLVGGCCEVHPPHIQEMHNYLQSRDSVQRVIAAHAAATQPPADDRAKRDNGRFSRKLKDGSFVVSVELLPPRGTSANLIASKTDLVRSLAENGLADAVDITDGSRGIPLMPPGDFIQLIREQLGWAGDRDDPLELIPHFTGRDLNVMGVQSRLVGYYARRIHNVLFITGDPPKMSPTYPRSTAVFDLDSVAMIRLTHQCLNAGVDFGGAPLGKPPHAPATHFTIGTGFEPEAVDQERELMRLDQKIENGADYVMTQPAFRFEPLTVLEPYRDRIPILVGVMILTGLAHAERMAQIPGVTVPAEILERLAAVDDPADQAQVGIDIAVDQVQRVVREGYAGLYLMSPGSADATVEVLRAAGPGTATPATG